MTLCLLPYCVCCVYGRVVTLVVESMYIHPVRWPVFCPSSLSCIHPHTHVHRLGGGGGGGSMKSQFQCCVLIASSIDYACAVCYAALFLFWERLCVETCFSVSRRYWAAREEEKKAFLCLRRMLTSKTALVVAFDFILS